MFLAKAWVVWYMDRVLLVIENVIGITVPPLDLSCISPRLIFIGLSNVTDNSLLVGTFIALLTGSVLVTVGEVTVKLVVNIDVNPLLFMSKMLFIGNDRVYVPGVRLPIGVMVKMFPLIVFVIGIFVLALFSKVIKA